MAQGDKLVTLDGLKAVYNNILNAYPENSATGNAASFADGAALPVKKLTADIVPWQTGSGDPSASNIRALTGWTGCNVMVDADPAAIYNRGSDGNTTTLEQGTLKSSNGQPDDSNYRVRSGYIRVTPGESYKINTNAPYLIVYQYRSAAAGTYIDTTNAWTAPPYTYTAGENTNYIRVLLAAKTSASGQRIDAESVTFMHVMSAEGAVKKIAFPQAAGTVYAGTLTLNGDGSGALSVRPSYASYAGETLTGPWISDRDVYAEGATPTTGAQVVDLGGETTDYTMAADQAHIIATLQGENVVAVDCGSLSLEYRADTNLCVDAIENNLMAITPTFSVDVENVTGFKYTISASNKWVAVTSGTARGSCITIPPNAKKVKIVSEVDGGVYAFLKTFENISASTSPDFSPGYENRIEKSAGTYVFEITQDMNYLYYLRKNSSGNSLAPTQIVFYLSANFYIPALCPYNITDFEGGSISASNGANTASSYEARTQNYHRINHNYLLCVDARHNFKVAYYDVDLNYIGMSENWMREKIVKKTDFIGAEYFRVKYSMYNTLEFPLESFRTSPNIMVTDSPEEVTKYTALTPDIPKNVGVLNIISRAKQCAEMAYTTLAVLPNQSGDIASGTDVVGLPYSSVREESLYVPNCVSFDSFMTSVLNPNSYLYTRQSTAPNSKTYLGAVCSSLVSYAYGLGAVYTTHQIGDLEDFELVEDQSVYGLELGCIVLRKNVHIGICTDILRDTRGRIKYVQITHAQPPFVHAPYYTPASFNSTFLSNNFKIYKYTKAYSVDYTPTQWVAVEGETPVTPAYNHNLFPRRGDKANWRYGESVVIDVVDEESAYTSYQLYKGETLETTASIPAGNVITLSGLSADNYKICLTDGENTSEFAYFSVVDATVTVEDQGGKTAKITFTCSSNAVPSWFAWCYSSGSDINAAKACFGLTAEDITNGYVVSQFEDGTFKFKVEVATDYGTYSSEFVTATITN